MEIIDSHAHLESEDFDADRAEMLERARAAGVRNILAIGSGGSGPDCLDAAIAVAKDYDWIYATIGIHPQHAAEAKEANYAQLDDLAKNPKVIAWGEMGLDYHYEEPPPETQQPVFRRQLQQARAAKLPIIIHCRDAWDDCLAILDKEWKPTGLGGIFHCFTGTLREAQRGLEMGFLVSFAANITYPKYFRSSCTDCQADGARRSDANDNKTGNPRSSQAVARHDAIGGVERNRARQARSAHQRPDKVRLRGAGQRGAAGHSDFFGYNQRTPLAPSRSAFTEYLHKPYAWHR